MLPADYLVTIDATGVDCALGFVMSDIWHSGVNYWLLGDNFMRGFYTIFDMETTLT